MNMVNLSVETERLRLASTRIEDAESVFENFTDKVAVYMFPVPAGSLEECRAWMRGAIEKCAAGEQWQFTIFDRVSGEFLGLGGVHDIKTDTPELGIWLAEKAWGYGYGREAMAGAMGWARENLKFRYVKYPVVKENWPSRKVAEFLGGVVEDEYPKANAVGVVRDLVEYRIYPGEGSDD